VPFSADILFQRALQSDTYVDLIGSVQVLPSQFLATYVFKGNTFYGRGTGKKQASEHLFHRIINSDQLPVVPDKTDPTEKYANATYVLTFNREETSAALVVTLDPNTSTDREVVAACEIPRGRHEGLMSLVRHILRESD